MRTACSVSSISPTKPGTTLTPASLASFLDSILSPIAAIAPTGGPMNSMPSAASCSERGPFGQEAVAGMDRLGAGLLAGGDDLVGDQVGLRRRRRADVDGLIGHLHERRPRIGVRIDGDRLDAHAARGL